MESPKPRIPVTFGQVSPSELFVMTSNRSRLFVYSLLHSPEVEEEEEEIKVPSNETINIFSIASGHLYERFLR